MKLKHIICFSIILVVAACNTGADKEAAHLQDSIKAAQRIDSITAEKKKNAYLIEAPDTNYTGDYLDKYDNGNTKFKGFFRFGKRHGQWVAFYANGLLWSECFYNRGLRHGANNVYYENGKPRYKGWYKDDIRDSLWVFYDPFGVEQKRTMFRNGEEIALPKAP
jgi:antitoxin component YwqK of YwqJK toxin-antitoxin module